jgi:hypothetical protein
MSSLTIARVAAGAEPTLSHEEVLAVYRAGLKLSSTEIGAVRLETTQGSVRLRLRCLEGVVLVAAEADDGPACRVVQSLAQYRLFFMSEARGGQALPSFSRSVSRQPPRSGNPTGA